MFKSQQIHPPQAENTNWNIFSIPKDFLSCENKISFLLHTNVIFFSYVSKLCLFEILNFSELKIWNTNLQVHSTPLVELIITIFILSLQSFFLSRFQSPRRHRHARLLSAIFILCEAEFWEGVIHKNFIKNHWNCRWKCCSINWGQWKIFILLNSIKIVKCVPVNLNSTLNQ